MTQVHSLHINLFIYTMHSSLRPLSDFDKLFSRATASCFRLQTLHIKWQNNSDV